jgi:hypothetical protein
MFRPFERESTRLTAARSQTATLLSLAAASRRRMETRRAPAADGYRLGIGRVEDGLSSAALRVLETTWRLWREPRAS